MKKIVAIAAVLGILTTPANAWYRGGYGYGGGWGYGGAAIAGFAVGGLIGALASGPYYRGAPYPYYSTGPGYAYGPYPGVRYQYYSGPSGYYYGY